MTTNWISGRFHNIYYKIGDVTEADEIFIIHGCNNRGVMGKGVAKTICTKFPAAYKSYQEGYARYDGNSKEFLGTFSKAWIAGNDRHNTKLIINAVTQDGYGTDGKRYVSYDALKEVFSVINYTYPSKSPIAMPKIGAGLGGGDWNIIEEIVSTSFPTRDIIVYVMNKKEIPNDALPVY
jgi:O-acetyl-ADP-ribose deacetylase (regulator of RNase III)